MKIRFLGAHMFESNRTRLSSILVDDVMAIDAGGLTSALSFEEQERIQTVLLTHGHYDHIRDIPALALKHQHRTIDIYAGRPTLEILTTHLINGTVYPRFHQQPSKEKPSLKLNSLEPNGVTKVNEYEVKAVPVRHAIPSVGYQVRDKQGNSVFFSGDTGPGLAACWEQINPDVLIIETALSNKSAGVASTPGHLCPSLLKKELEDFRRLKNYLPRVFITHMNPEVEEDIRRECRQVSDELEAEIDLAYEDMELVLPDKPS